MTDSSACPITGLKKILYATDGSLHSEKALKEAVNLSKTCGTKLFVITVVDVNPEYATMAPNVIERAETEARELLEEVRKCASKEGIEVELIMHEGDEPWKFIVDEAKGRNIDMIVMGSHGRTGLSRLLMGSVTEKVIGHSPCMVLVVPA